MDGRRRSSLRALLAAVLVAATLAVGGAGGSGGAHASERAVPGSRDQITLSFAPLVRRAAPAVVNIFARKVVRSAAPFGRLFDDPFFRRFFGGDPRFGVPRERVERSLGSGVLVSTDGLVVTNAHVIGEADEIRVVLNDRREFDAYKVTVDERTDLAILQLRRVEGALPSLPLGDSDALEVGDLVLAIGNPFGVGQTVTSGIVSALARTTVGVSDYSFFIQTDAAINPGNSGGALLAMDGQVVGINTAIYSRSGGSIGIGFAVPSAMVRAVLSAVQRGEPLVRPWTGIAAQSVDRELAQSLGLDRPAGVLVRGLHRLSPGHRAGLRPGDVITAVDGRSVDDPPALRYRLATYAIGGSAVLTVVRGGRTREVVLPLIAAPEDPPRRETLLEGRHPLAGARVANLSPAVAETLGFDDGAEGVVVLRTLPRSPAVRVGVRAGDVVAAVNGRAIIRVRDLEGVLRRAQRRWRLDVRRDGRLLTVTVPGF